MTDDARGRWVRPLAALDRHAVADAGGKAANLGELIRAGLPVPDGFCVTTDAFAAATRAIAGWDARMAAMARTRAEDAGALAALAAQARDAIERAELPAAIAAACARAYAALGARAAVAVRSSATAEDLPDASFAGQQDTYLNVVGEAALLDAVRRCWASLFTERAVAYRARGGIDPAGVRIAVAVQRMVAPRVAGVLFTADPISGRRHRAVIDASPGLGEAVVSGAVNPDHFEVETRTGRVLARRLGDKRVRIDAVAGGGTVRVATDAGAAPCVGDDELAALAALGARVEALYGAPQDLEWAIDGAGTLWLVQARPITTLHPLPAGALDDPRGLRVYFSFSVAQGVLGPTSPLGVHAFALIASGVARILGVRPTQSPVAEAAHRVFLDATVPLRSDVGRPLLGLLLPHGEARAAAMMAELFDDPRLAVVPVPRRAQIAFALQFARRTRIPARMLAALVAPARAVRRGQRFIDRALALGDVAPGDGPAAQLDAVERMLVQGTPWIALGNFPVFVAGLLALRAARWLLGADASPHELETAMRALPDNPTTQMDLALWALAQAARSSPEAARAIREQDAAALVARYRAGTLPAPLQGGLDAFLARYGARGVAEIDAGVARWSDDPSPVLGILRNYLAHGPDRVAPDAQFARAEREAEAMVHTLSARASARGAWRGLAVALALGRARALAGVRERPKFGVVQTLAVARRRVQSVGAALVAQGRLVEADDAFLLTVPELRAALAGDDPRAVCAARRASLAREARRRDLPRWLLSDGTSPRATPLASSVDGALVGTPASAGTVTARARVVREPNGATLEPGEVLVAPSTDPGWTPLFLTAGGLVMEMGGAMSHGAVVAREYGIPAVVGVAQATARIATGDVVTIDGAAGTVKIDSTCE